MESADTTPAGRVLAIGDIHGCSRALDLLLAQVQPTPADLVVTLGDYIDRGPDSRGVLDRLLDLEKRCRLIALQGNHEEMLLVARSSGYDAQGWLHCGGRETLASYSSGGNVAHLSAIPDAHWDFLQRLVDYHEIDTHFFVHAGAQPDLPLSEQPGYALRWEPLHRPDPHRSGKVMVCGHTAQRLGLPLNLGHAICIDTWVYGQGWLSCLDVRAGQVWQANQRGEQRVLLLEDAADEWEIEW